MGRTRGGRGGRVACPRCDMGRQPDHHRLLTATDVPMGKSECARRHTGVSMKHFGEMLLSPKPRARATSTRGMASSHNIVLANFTRSRVMYKWGGLPVDALKTRAKFDALMCTSTALVMVLTVRHR